MVTNARRTNHSPQSAHPIYTPPLYPEEGRQGGRQGGSEAGREAGREAHSLVAPLLGFLNSSGVVRRQVHVLLPRPSADFAVADEVLLSQRLEVCLAAPAPTRQSAAHTREGRARNDALNIVSHTRTNR